MLIPLICCGDPTGGGLLNVELSRAFAAIPGSREKLLCAELSKVGGRIEMEARFAMDIFSLSVKGSLSSLKSSSES